MKLTANPAWLWLSPHIDKESGAKFLRIMKLTTIIILAACLHTSAKGIAQQTITFSGKEVKLENVFNAIKKQTNYRFFFNTDMLSNASKVTIEVKNANVEQVMQMALKDQPLTFTIKGRTIFIMKKVEEEKKGAQVAPTGDPITVSGRVTDENGEPLVGANVKVKGSQNGSTTDSQGHFTINNVDPNASLEISFVGRETEILSVKGKTVFSVALGQKQSILDETVVIAYGTTSRRFSTGNIANVKASDIEKQPVQNPLLALQGRVPGLLITQNSGVPGGGIVVRIQGLNSINNGNDPFIVIDGVPYPSQMPAVGSHDAVLGSSAGITGPGGNGNPLNYINPADIESIDILKDADATAIYGSRAANGAILITTKKGKVGKTKLDINAQQGWGNVTKTMKMLNRRQYLDMRYEAFKNDGVDLTTLTPNSRNWDLTVWDTTRYTDWQKELIGNTSRYTNVNANVSGGTSIVQYLIGATYHRETSVFLGDFADQKGSMHFNINSTSASQRFRMQFSGNYMVDNNKLPGVDLTRDANLLEPVAPALYNPDGTLNWAPRPGNGNSTWEVHPLANVLYSNYSNKTNNLVSNLQLGYTILKGLELKSSFGYTYLQATDFTSVPLVSQKPEFRPFIQRSATYGSRLMRSWIIEPQIVYKAHIGKGRLESLLGSSIQQSKSNSGSILGEGYTSDQLLYDFRAAAKLTAAASTIAEYKYNALFGRINYNWNEKYIINLNARRDGSSRFGANNRFHNFGSVGAAWIFSQEKLLKSNVPFISFGKLRGSYGTTGNDQIPDYQFLSLYTSSTPGVPYQGALGLYPLGIPNPYLQWEETKKLQFGIDLGFIQDRIFLSATYARNRSSNQLIQYILSVVSGNNSLTQNFPATVQNTSLEFSLNTVNIKGKNVEWTSGLNVTIPDNKLLAFPNIENSTYAKLLSVGYPLITSKLYSFSGADPVTGLYQVVDREGKTTMTPDPVLDKTILISKMAKLYGGFQNRVSFKGIELDFLLQFVKQKGVNNFFNNGTSVTPGLFVSGSSNQPVSVMDRWQKPDDISNIQKFSSQLGGKAYEQLALAQAGSLLVTDASYIRLKNVSITWKIPTAWYQKIDIQNCRVFVQSQNLLTITNYKGGDPENQSYATLPPLRVITIGFHIGF
jgi:TonB-dependent starch-binding outer membrane protein SusC